MLLPVSFPAPILNTVLDRLGPLFVTGADGDTQAAREAATALLASFDVRSEQELSLAADVISFGFHSLGALSQAMADDLSLNKVIRLRGSAVSLNREAHRSRQKLEQLQRDRRAASIQPLAEVPACAFQVPAASVPAPSAAMPGVPMPAAAVPAMVAQAGLEQAGVAAGGLDGAAVDGAGELLAMAREAIKIAGGGKKQGKYGGMTYAQSLQKRMTAKRIVDNAKRKAAQDNARIARENAQRSAAGHAAASGAAAPVLTGV